MDGLHSDRLPLCKALAFFGQPYTEADDLVLGEWSLEGIARSYKKYTAEAKAVRLVPSIKG
jgi:hypothetical protein